MGKAGGGRAANLQTLNQQLRGLCKVTVRTSLRRTPADSGNAALHVHDGHLRAERSRLRSRRVSQVTRRELLGLRGRGGLGPGFAQVSVTIALGQATHAAWLPTAHRLPSPEVPFVESDPDTRPERVKGNE